ncbi:ABC transporter substrate-binding protein [Desulfolutivibrio sp.]|uniref:ABC transporter substrate-binding protein n=1 Tax=Desulfolutivibrio sp. TaxID=2773296 RepID=UPI002F960F2B
MTQEFTVPGQEGPGREKAVFRIKGSQKCAPEDVCRNGERRVCRTARLDMAGYAMAGGLTFFAILLLVLSASSVWAAPPQAVSKVPMVMVGDRLVDAAFNLRVLPEAMVVRKSLWPLADEMAHTSQVLGCPNKVMNKKPDTLPSFMKQRGMTRILVEKNARPCLYFDLTYDKIAEIVKDVPGVSVEYIDFDKGEVPAIQELAALLGVQEKGAALVTAYEAKAARAKEALPEQGLGKRVVVLSGVYSEDGGTKFTRIEAPGGYTDTYILTPLGCVNAADVMIQDTKDIDKGHVTVRDLSSLMKANPDVIAITGDAYAVQKNLSDNIKRHPEMAKIPALKNGAVYSLPFYANNGVLEYPNILRQWADALKN